MRFFQQLGYVQQSFRRNATAIEADSSRIQLWVDQGDVHTEIGGKKSCSISTGPPPTTAMFRFVVSDMFVKKVSSFKVSKLKSLDALSFETLKP